MYQYAPATARDLPVLWMPEPYGVNETAFYVRGMNTSTRSPVSPR